MQKKDYEERILLRRLLKEANAYDRKAHKKFSAVMGMASRINALRNAMRAKVESIDWNTRDRERKRILDVIRNGEPQNVNIKPEVGRGISAKSHTSKQKGRGASNTLWVTVGYMWRRKVFGKILNGRLTNANEVFVLSAKEYRINVPQVRLYAVTVWDYKEWKLAHGFIGQSKLGKQACTYRKRRDMAINAARSLGGEAINKNLRGEVE